VAGREGWRRGGEARGGERRAEERRGKEREGGEDSPIAISCSLRPVNQHMALTIPDTNWCLYIDHKKKFSPILRSRSKKI
jgi:hypothetical protein